MTCTLPSASGIFVSSSRRRNSETAITASARRIEAAVAVATPGIAPTLRTSLPCAVRTRRGPTRPGGRPGVAAAPAGGGEAGARAAPPGGERGGRAGREEEMGVDDLGMEAA